MALVLFKSRAFDSTVLVENRNFQVHPCWQFQFSWEEKWERAKTSKIVTVFAKQRNQKLCQLKKNVFTESSPKQYNKDTLFQPHFQNIWDRIIPFHIPDILTSRMICCIIEISMNSNKTSRPSVLSCWNTIQNSRVYIFCDLMVPIKKLLCR